MEKIDNDTLLARLFDEYYPFSFYGLIENRRIIARHQQALDTRWKECLETESLTDYRQIKSTIDLPGCGVFREVQGWRILLSEQRTKSQ
ncbi:MAG: hypothetical protein AAF741_18600 [Bacteroidota bacterium]